MLINPSSITALLIFLKSSYSASISLTLTANTGSRVSVSWHHSLIYKKNRISRRWDKNIAIHIEKSGAVWAIRFYVPMLLDVNSNFKGSNIQTVSLAKSSGSSRPFDCLYRSRSQHFNRTAKKGLSPSRHCNMILSTHQQTPYLPLERNTNK